MTRPFTVVHLTCFFNRRLKALDRVHISRLVNETCWIVLVQAGMQANQFANAIDDASNITNFTENCTDKSFFFFSWLKRDFNYLIFASVIRKGISRKHPIPENNICMLSSNEKSGKQTVIGMCIFSLICAKTVNIKNNFENALYLLRIESKEKKFYLKYWIVARRSNRKYQQ